MDPARKSIENLLYLMQVQYLVKEANDTSALPTVTSQLIYIAPVDYRTMGFFPTQGRVESVIFGPQMEKSLRKRILEKTSEYDHDSEGRALVRFRLSEKKRLIKKHGLDFFHPGHLINLYLE